MDNKHELYGSIHTHFESQYDTGNVLAEMITNFYRAGAHKIAATEHGVFSSFEDLKDTLHYLQTDPKQVKKWQEAGLDVESIPEDYEMEIIPGIECYFGEEAAHLILVAKDYEGYKYLCKIISEANENIQTKNGKAIVTLENLQKYVKEPGHLTCTSACIAGPFGRRLGLKRINLETDIADLEKEISDSGYLELTDFESFYESEKKRLRTLKPTKAAENAANKLFKKTGDNSLLIELENRTAEYNQLNTWLTENEDKYKLTVKQIQAMKRAVWSKKVSKLDEKRLELSNLEADIESGELDAECKELLQNFLDIFGKDDFYFELQSHFMESEKEIYNNIVRFAYEAGHPKFIASNDIHIGLTKDNPNYESALKRRNVAKFLRYGSYFPETEDDKEYTIKGDEELTEILSKELEGYEDISGETIAKEAVGNIKLALEQCHVEFPKDQKYYPKFCDDENTEFERKVRKGIKQRFPDGFPDERYVKRLEYELNVIKTMGYAGYHLIVADYLTYGRLLGYLPTVDEVEKAPFSIEELDKYITEKGYPRIGYSIGPGRGSAVGSLCCYLMGITDIDPIPYNLLFERFLNVERVSMPDIDSDFKTDVRAKVEDYCRAKYGAECICKIMTKSYGATKGNLRLAARYYGTIAYEEEYGEFAEENDAIQSAQSLEELEEVLADADPKYKEYMKPWYNKADKLAKAFDNDGVLDPEAYPEDERRIIELANTLEGLFTGYGQHAAGTIISSTDVTNVIPLMWNKKKGAMETQCTMAQAEAKGLLKMDFLGLQNLDIITNIIQKPWRKMDQDGLLQDYKRRDKMLKDPKIYRDIFWTGLTQGVFQFESDGMKKMLMDFKPETFEDIILLVAAYRPGPLQYLPEIIQQKQYTDQQAGKEWASISKIGVIDKPKHSININNKALNDILEPTYGCIIYQEQVMQIFQNLAGYSLGGADLVRRAMSKKKTTALEKERIVFLHGDPERGIEGCIKKQGISEKDANNLFDQMMEFAKYAFNKSHATAYAMVAMFTAYCKEYHTADFFRYSLDATKELKEVPAFLKEMPKFHITMKPPTMLESENGFSVEDDGHSLRYSFKRIKGFSEQDIVRNTTAQDFMTMNPNVSVKMMETYASLGFFNEAWNWDKKYGRVQGNRHEIMRWVQENAETYKKFLAIVEKTDTEKAELNEMQEKLSNMNLNTEKGAAYAKEVEAAQKQYDKDFAKRKEIADLLNVSYQDDKANHMHVKETDKEVLENRAKEVELLSTAFDIGESKKRLEMCKNPRTFKDLEIAKNDNYGENTISIPAIVLSVSAEKKAKTSGKTYYEVSLMDRNGEIINRRFAMQPEVLDGQFQLTLDEVKYFTCTMNQYKPLVIEKKAERHETYGTNATAAVNALQKGNTQTYQLPGNKHIKMVTVPEEVEQEERDDL